MGTADICYKICFSIQRILYSGFCILNSFLEVTMATSFQWQCQPKAETLILEVLEQACRANSDIAFLEMELLKHTSTRLLDWIDHVIVGNSTAIEKALEHSGFIAEMAAQDYRVFHHPGAQLPRVVVKDQGQSVCGIAISVESIADFLMVRGLNRWIEGSPSSPYRRCCISKENDVLLWAIERRGTLAFDPSYLDSNAFQQYEEARERWQTRPRDASGGDDDSLMARTVALAQELVRFVGQDTAAWIVLEVERKYWQSRNTAGQLQKNRQDRLGMGWANHDHHTFRSSRRHFHQLVRLFEILGFHCRERYYAGAEAGWGAQVMENPICKLVLFLDVDLDPSELDIDFAHHPLPSLPTLGTIGLWCALHGDSILRAGMHHLEAQFMFDELTKDLGHVGIRMMDPFSQFPYLKQAFTAGEIWPVDPKRIYKLIEEGKISHEQADKFLSMGAIGSHLENLQRREGYKGFNQKNVSVIIKKTDPRLI